MKYESARRSLAQEFEQGQITLITLKEDVLRLQANLANKEVAVERQLVYLHELGEALTALGGPIPDWTADPQLIQFWEEINGVPTEPDSGSAGSS